MTKKDIIIKKLAKKYNKDSRIIQEIVGSPLKFANRVIRDPYDERPVRIRYFGVFVQKTSYNKENKLRDMVKTLLNNINDVLVVMASTLGYDIDKAKNAKRIIDDATRDKDFEKIRDIYNAYKEYTK